MSACADATNTRELSAAVAASWPGAALPVLSCTAWGFSCPAARATGGGRLTRLFTLAATLVESRRYIFCDTVRRGALTHVVPAHSARHAAWRCSDFPLL